MSDQGLVNYISKQREAGVSDGEIKDALMRNNDGGAVAEAFEALENGDVAPQPKQRPKKKRVTRSAGNRPLLIMAVAGTYIVFALVQSLIVTLPLVRDLIVGTPVDPSGEVPYIYVAGGLDVMALIGVLGVYEMRRWGVVLAALVGAGWVGYLTYLFGGFTLDMFGAYLIGDALLVAVVVVGALYYRKMG